VQRASDLYRDRGLAVVTVAIDTDPQRTVPPFVRERGVRLPVTEDPDGRLQQQFGMRGHPSFVFIDREGRIVGTALGYRDWLSPAGRAFFDAFTGGAPR
jgi:hypothetical protein